jgi:uncharacterized protein YecT (DUF1311 family)
MVDVRAGVPLLALALAITSQPSKSGQHLLQKHDKSWASFECQKALNRTEKLICSDTTLSESDGFQNFMYRRLLRHSPVAEHAKIRSGQRLWLKRRDACADKKCLLDIYYAREDSLREESERQDRILRRPVSQTGQCQVTTIEYIGPRLANVPTSDDRPDEAGTSVGFTNGVWLVSYAFERPVARSTLGDRARVCLVSIPKHCPPGDDRGRVYAVTNLHTGGKWRMPDAEHMCGGA